MSGVNNNIKNQVYTIIKERLVNCIYEPGSFLNEIQLAQELGCSRTPVREAISRLEQENLVQIFPKKGIYVTDISLNDVQQIFQTRLEIEPITLRMAADHLPMDTLKIFRKKFSEDHGDYKNDFNLDTIMHLFIIENCGNRYLIDIMQKVFEDNTRVILSSKQNQMHVHDARQEHLNIIDALIEHDVDKAAELMKEHVECCRKYALDYFYNMPSRLASFSSNYKTALENELLKER